MGKTLQALYKIYTEENYCEVYIFSLLVHAKSLQSCLTLCDPMDCSLPGSSIRGILQARTRVGCHALLQGIFPTQGLNLGLVHCRQILYH